MSEANTTDTDTDTTVVPQVASEGGCYHLRDRTTIREPMRYRDSREEQKQFLSGKRRERNGKKTGISKRINTLLNLIQNNGSRTKIKFLHSELCGILQEAVQVHDELMLLMDEDDPEFTDDWIEELRGIVSECSADVADYLERRADDTRSSSSTKSLCNNWVQTGSITQQSEHGECGDPTEFNISHLSTQLDNTLNLHSPVVQASIPTCNIDSCANTPMNVVYTSSNYETDMSGTSKVLEFGAENYETFPLTFQNNEKDTFFIPKMTPLPKGNVSTQPNPVTMINTDRDNAHRGSDVRKRDFASLCTRTGLKPGTASTTYVPLPSAHLQSLQGYGRHTVTVTDIQGSTGYRAHSQPWLYSNVAERSGRSSDQVNSTNLIYTSPTSAASAQPLLYNHLFPACHITNQASIPSTKHTNVQIASVCHAPLSVQPSLQNYYAARSSDVTWRQPNSLNATDTSRLSRGDHQPLWHNTSFQNGIPNEINSQNVMYTNPRFNVNQDSRNNTNVPNNGIANLMNVQSTIPGYDSAVQHLPANSGAVSDMTAADVWIDNLDPFREETIEFDNTATNITLQWLSRQDLPQIKVPVFDGAPEGWIEFVINFHEVIHKRPHLSGTHRMGLLLQHVDAEAKRCMQVYSKDWYGYVSGLKRLKFMFGQKAKIAQVHLAKATRGKQIKDDDFAGLVDFYYCIGDCLTTLTRMCYFSDVESTDVLRQAVARLPNRLRNKWAEYSYALQMRTFKEPKLSHLETWLGDRIMAARNPYLPTTMMQRWPSSIERGRRQQINSFATTTEYEKNNTESEGEDQGNDKDTKHDKRSDNNDKRRTSCPLCNGTHILFRCWKFDELSSVERLNVVKKQTLCFNCLRPNHNFKKCGSKFKCQIGGCGDRHNTKLHDSFCKIPPVPVSTSVMLTENVDGRRRVYLQVVPVKVLTPEGKTFTTYAMLDNGSQSTLIREDFAKKIGLSGRAIDLSIGTITQRSEEVKGSQVCFKVMPATFEGETFSVDSAYVIPSDKFNTPSQHLPSDFESKAKYSHLHGLGFKDVSAKEITILLAADVPKALVAQEIREGNKGQPLAVCTPLGWSLLGVADGAATSGKIEMNSHTTLISVNRVSLQEQVEEFWTTESFGTKFDFKSSRSTLDQQLLKRMSETTYLSDGHYVVGKLWKENSPTLPNNRPMAEKRLEGLCKKLLKQPELHKLYSSTIQTYIRNGYCRKLPADEARQSSHRTSYLPHHPVLNPNKPGKVRPVFDCSAKYYGVSINDKLETGPDLVNNLPGQILRFRKYPYAVMGDIEAMFYQVKVHPSDCDSLRLLWKDDLSNNKIDTYQMLVHVFGARDSPCCSSYALQRTAEDNRKQFSHSVIETVTKDFYVDDWLKSMRTASEAISLTVELVDLLQRGGFNLTKFKSNCPKVSSVLPHSSSEKVQYNMDMVSQVERTLGLEWDLVSDCFLFSAVHTSQPVTKRGILKVISTIFDPLGFLAPFIIKPKMLLQELWEKKYDWDEDIDASLAERWHEWLNDLGNIVNYKLPRCFITDPCTVKEIELHIFSDASELAFGGVGYLRIKYLAGDVTVRYAMAKSRLAPLKRLTIPKLELQAAVLAVRMSNTILHEIELEIKNVYFWVDATLVLQYIQNIERRFNVFVGNRVAEILEHSTPSQWRHVSGKMNPADAITRGLDMANLLGPDSDYELGPKFLYESEENWPDQPDVLPLSNMEPGIRKSVMNILTIVEIEEELTKFSSWMQTLYVCAWMFRFFHNTNKTSGRRTYSTFLSVSEIEYARKRLLLVTQLKFFAPEIQALKEQDDLPASSKLRSLKPFLDSDALLKVGGRLKNARIPSAAKHQIILPKRNWISTLITQYTHKINPGCGKEHIIAVIRQNYWILGSRQLVDQVLKNCKECNRKNAKPTEPIMADLPETRVSDGNPPFTHTGVDYFGPLLIKQARSRLKRWCCLFTCMSTRAVHLELSESLSTDAFINTLERFINRRGHPNILFSDCGSNFQGANNELKRCLKEIDNTKVGEFATRNMIQWRFNPPAAPHMGGVWERLVRSVKTTLKAIMKERILTDFQLYTVLTEVECLVNCRPLTPVSDNVDDFEPLTPNHFLIGRQSPNLPFATIYQTDHCSRKQWRQVQYVTNCFWKRWLREYLPTLTCRTKWRKRSPNLKCGDVVIVEEKGIPRGQWKLARVNKVFPGNDGVVRIAEIMTPFGSLIRPVTKLYLLEETPDE